MICLHVVARKKLKVVWRSRHGKKRQ